MLFSMFSILMVVTILCQQADSFKLEVLQQMEKNARTFDLKKCRRKLPTIPHNKSVAQLPPKLNELLSSQSHLNDLRKLFYQYKSNANILVNSPYYTNRQQQHYLVNYIQANRHEPTPEQLKQIMERFPIQQYTEEPLHLPLEQIGVKLHAFNLVVDLNVGARTIGELQVLLKRQYAIQQVKANGFTKRVDFIGGFESVKPNPKLDFLLAQKQSSVCLPAGKYDVKPWFLEEVKSKVSLRDFRFIRCLGSGGFSLVYLVRDKWRGEFHALKLIDKSFILQSERDMIVENERYVLGQLNSPFVTALNFCFQTKNHFVFAIEYCPGGELFYQLKKVRRMTEVQARFYFLQILLGLDYIHKKGIVYRDLKPENLLIGADGHVRIADFGLAKPLMGREAAYSFCGSPQYMAPEMLLKTGHNHNLDYYCLGALLYELVIGVPPYYSLNHDEIYQGILHQELAFPNNAPLSSEIKSLLQALLEKKPEKRLGSLYGVKEILIHPWVGRVNRKDIQDKKLVPPFMPDLTAFNFDESDLEEKTKQTNPKIEEDIRCIKFQTHFNDAFYYADPFMLPETKKAQKSSRDKLGRSLEKKTKTRSVLRRIVTDRGKSK